jgi:hypothetical protein
VLDWVFTKAEGKTCLIFKYKITSISNKITPPYCLLSFCRNCLLKPNVLWAIVGKIMVIDSILEPEKTLHLRMLLAKVSISFSTLPHRDRAVKA